MVEQLLARLQSAATSRATFAEPAAQARKAVRLARGPAAHKLIAFPAPLALCGPQQYARLAQTFRGVRDTLVLTIPGFVGTERVPATLSVAIDDQAQAIMRAADGATPILAGYSTGGTLAYGMAAHLASIGVPVGAVVLLDAYPTGEQTPVTEQLAAVILRLFRNPQWSGYLNDTRLSAMGWYTRLVMEWKLTAVSAPTLLVRPTSPMPGVAGDGAWQAVWPFKHDCLDVPGDHYTMMEEHADSTAAAVEQWLNALPAAQHP